MQTNDCLVRAGCGKLGSGKTYDAVKRAMEALMCGMKLVTNVQLDWDAVNRYCRKQGMKGGIPRENYAYFDTTEICEDVDKLCALLCANSMLLFDEVHLALDSRNWQENKGKSEGLQVLMTQARKFKVEMWFIAQAHENMDKRIVRQCTNIVRYTNWLHFPLLGNLFPIPLTIAKWCDADGRTVQSREWIWRKKDVFACYKSSQAFCGLELTGSKPRAVVGQRRKKMPYGYTLIIVGLVLVAFQAWLDSGKDEKEPAKSTLVETRKPVKKGALVYEEQPPPVDDRPRVVRPETMEIDSVSRFEVSLPRLLKAAAFGLICENRTYRPGDVLGCGRIRSWRKEADGVTVYLQSPVMPEVRLFYHANITLCTTLGTPLRRPVRGGDGPPEVSMGQVPVVADKSVLVPPAAQETPFPAVESGTSPPTTVYEHPLPFVPQVTTIYRSVSPGK